MYIYIYIYIYVYIYLNSYLSMDHFLLHRCHLLRPLTHDHGHHYRFKKSGSAGTLFTFTHALYTEIVALVFFFYGCIISIL